MKKVVFAAAVLAAIVSATGTASAVSSSVFPITAQEGFIRIAPSDPTVEDLEAALDVLVLAVELVAADLARAERA